MKDRTGQDYRLAAHNARSIDLVAPDGRHVQVKTVGTRSSFAGIRRGRDAAAEVLVIATFCERPQFCLVPMERFKALARIYDYPERDHFSWEISGHRIAKGVLDECEIAVTSDGIDPLVNFRECSRADDRKAYRAL